MISYIQEIIDIDNESKIWLGSFVRNGNEVVSSSKGVIENCNRGFLCF